MNDVWNVHAVDPENPGDTHCAPARYVRWIRPHYVREADLFEPLPATARGVIVGGGGLFREPVVIDRVRALLDSYPRAALWGAGLNRHGGGADDMYPAWVRGLRLAGVRDWGLGLRWVPCASCLSPLLDGPWGAPDREAIAIAHCRLGLESRGLDTFYLSGRSMLEALDAIHSSAAVITNSYHAAYWATLAGRKVVVIDPWSSKFFFMRYPPTFATPETWRDRLRDARAHPEALSECRAANRAFAEDVADLIATP